MKTLVQLALAGSLAGALTASSYAQDPGPYYFVTDNLPGPGQFYWGTPESFGGIRVIENLNLLAAVLGDVPSAPAGGNLVARQTFGFGSGSVQLQPFAFRTPASVEQKNPA